MGIIKMSTKAKTLHTLRDIVKKSYIEDMEIFKVKDYYKDRVSIFHRISEHFRGEIIVVRSSSKNEDSMASSNAGHYESVLNVHSKEMDEVFSAIEKVIDSYLAGTDSEDSKAKVEEEEILVQTQSKDIVLSGVVFTRDIIYNRPYYMISYDDGGGTDTVTGGCAGKTKWIARNFYREFIDEKFLKIIQAVKEIELLFFNVEALDIEFGLNKDGKVIIFQVRPLSAIIGKARPMSDRDFTDVKAYAKCIYLDTNHILSDMAFWNPAEMIGTNPRPLDYSLYRELITERIWSEGISKLGYELVNEELMQKIGNKPYISLNCTFAGLTPQGINEQLKFKLFDYYEEQLKKDKNSHDKIEFEIVFNTFDFMTKERLKKLLDYGFTEEEIGEIESALYELTKKISRNFEKVCEEDKKSIEKLASLRHEMRANNPLTETNVMKLYKYIETIVHSIKEDGTPQFTRQARYAFMARSFCRTLVESGYFSQEEVDAFLGSVPTIASQFERDFALYSHGELSRENFNQLYGHLRLGTYDIRSDTYRNLHFETDSNYGKISVNEQGSIKYLNEDRLAKALKEKNIPMTVLQMHDFLIKATQNREYYKFEFTKSLSLMLDLIIRMGEILGIAREDMSYLEIQDLLSYHSRDSYLQIISERRNMYHLNTYLELPEVIFSVGDIDIIENSEARPNFITNKSVTADLVFLDNDNSVDIEGKIVVLSKADPGYDWIFTKKIAGFVTKYGGAASHMAIRCAEFDIPAALGCGEKIYQRILRMTRMELNCGDKKIIEH